jgi:phosphatidylinositol glycan class U
VWQFNVADLTPNVGVFWYMFQVMFSQFDQYFKVVFQMHPLLHIIPMTVRLHERPLSLSHALLGVVTLFKPYTTLGNFGFLYASLSMHTRTIVRCRLLFWSLVVASGVSSALPVMWHLWINSGAGNANFFYFQALIFSFANGFVVMEFVSITVKRIRERHGRPNALLPRPSTDGSSQTTAIGTQ